ncbi:MAG: cellulase family glycosylhydrolase [Clostridia bacterium]|nr:cellulase family glycosylhydrolase [Clostridia bacterium]
MGERWSKERIWEWYDARPWLRGCNFMGSDCANRIDQWQELGFEERLETADRELALCAETGFNTVRLIPEFIVWYQEHDGFFERFDRYLDVCAKHGISAMVVLGNDCMPPMHDGWKMPSVGEQHYDWGYHGGRKISQHGQFNTVGYHLLDDPKFVQPHYDFVREIVTRYKDDERIIIWDVYNEPGNSNRKDMSLPHLKKFFEICREIDPIQPLTCGLWRGILGGKFEEDKIEMEIQKFGYDNSDIISFHQYGTYENNCALIKCLRRSGRPLINTEWLARCQHNNVEEIFPLYYLEKIGCYCWGFVAGKYQTYEPYNSAWSRYEKDPKIDFDFTKWFHDLYRPSLRPYNPKEIEIIKRFCSLADEDFKKDGR